MTTKLEIINNAAAATGRLSTPGIYPDFSAADYFDDPCPQPSLTQSIAKVLIERSPGHARLEHPRLCPPIATEDEEPEKYIAAQAIGNAAHAVLIGRGKEIAVGDFDSWRSKDAKAFKDAALLEGHTPILCHHMARAFAMVKAANDQLLETECNLAFRDGAGEVVIAWQEDGFWFRTLIDWISNPVEPLYIFDYKSTALSCAPHKVADRPGEMGWDIQAAMHERALDAVDPINAGRRKFFYINQENSPPYALTPIRISEHDLTMGRKKLEYAITAWKICMGTDRWPLYSRETVLSCPRGYRETQWLERETIERGLATDQIMAG